jgi:hypothetical protein
MRREKLKVSQVIDALRLTEGMVYHAAERLRIAPVTLYEYAKRHPSIRDVIEDERGKFVDTGELALKAAVLRGEGWAIAFLLKTLGKDRGYVDRQQLDAVITTNSDSAPIIRTIAALTGGSGSNLPPSSQDEDAVDGETVGQDDSRSLARYNGSGSR